MPRLTTDDQLEALLTGAKTIAVVGLSNNPERDSYGIAKYLQSKGYIIYPINPAQKEILGQKCYPSVSAIGHPVDIVDVFRRPEAVPEVVEDAISSGSKAIWMQLGVVNEDAAARAEQAGLSVVMDHCIGVDHRRLVRA
jgi:predicted CoA-binding protein